MFAKSCVGFESGIYIRDFGYGMINERKRPFDFYSQSYDTNMDNTSKRA